MGDAAKKIHQAEKAYEAAAATKNVAGMKAAMQQAADVKRTSDFTNKYGGALSNQWVIGGAVHWMNPVTGNLEKIPGNASVSVDHILPQNYIKNLEGFDKLPVDIQKSLINDSNNLQPMIHSANCSKGCKVEFIDGRGWQT
ncbi:hypothetical protein [Stenoxybacter acetivorans]|uniref:hypothetical protein n=1 Tax=Stenoxybacter acetivorans TaxID=422441 RepID=UPI0012EBEC45|nr:hypothetical protein [Stenoxybacter acetivorans]